jgi:amphi-Trp domain-containing protein
MPKQNKKPERDIEKHYTKQQFVAKLRRLADCIEQGKRFQIQVAGERISVPADAVFNIEHERETSMEEVEFQVKWPI